MSTQHPQSVTTPTTKGALQQHEVLRYLNKYQVAEMLSVSKRTIDAWVATGFIPHTKIRRTIRFIPEEIEAWVRGETVTVHRAKPAKVT